jgi:DNA-binding beta-propeller fold protein YncE
MNPKDLHTVKGQGVADITLLLLAALAALLFFAPPAATAAEAPSLLYATPFDEVAGSGAGEMKLPLGVAADPTSGHLFVADSENNRVSEFTAWGAFVKAWGWGVANGASELQSCGPGAEPPSSTCRKGLAGTGAGQFNGTNGGIVLGSDGNVWVADLQNYRVQKFDPDGNFLFMIGGDVDKGPSHAGDICTAAYLADGDLCGAGTAGPGTGEFATPAYVGFNLAAGPAGKIYVGDVGRIQEFESDGSFSGQIDLESSYASKHVHGLARTTAGDFYVSLAANPNVGAENTIRKVAPTGAAVGSIPLSWTPTSFALDSTDNLFVAIRAISSESKHSAEVIEFGPAGEPVIAPGEGFAQRQGLGGGVHSYFGLAVNVVTAAGENDVYLIDLTSAPETGGTYLASVKAFGPPPDKWAPPSVAPEIVSQYATTVGEQSAVVLARINPRFWADATYSVEYGTGKCSEGGCSLAFPVPAADLGGGVVSEPLNTTPLELPGLDPGTIYHYRFRAQSSGGGPAVGIGVEEEEGTFRTRTASQLNESCTNQAFRTGAAARLADCRAYEMVSPISKNGSGIRPPVNSLSYRVQYNQSSLSGDSLTYTSYRAFGDAISAPYGVQYLASRGAGEWASRALNPPKDGTGPEGEDTRFDLEPEFAGFSDDLSKAWLENRNDPPLTSDAASGVVNIYERDNATGAYRAVTNTTPRALPPSLEPGQVRFQGRAGNADVTVFSSQLELTPDASEAAFENQRPQVYASIDGEVHLVSLLPNGESVATGATAGSSPYQAEAEKRGSLSLENAVSEDGSRIFWTSAPRGEGPGKLYVRLNNSDTLQIAAGEVYFRKATPSGSEVLYERFPEHGSGNLFKYDLRSKKAELVAGEVLGVLGASEDLSHVYFVSEAELAPGSADGAFNLYLDQDGQVTYVARLSAFDVNRAVSNSSTQNLISRWPIRRSTRVTPDGVHLAFTSDNSLVPGYDNLDQATGNPASQVYWYSAGEQKLVCVSCDPSGARPAGQRLRVPYTGTDEPVSTDQWAAAWLTTTDSSFHAPRALSSDGTRLFFNSFTPLVTADTNGLQDVYQWEANGAGDCESDEGCISLISDGGAPFKSEFIDADPSGDNVFFETAASLVPVDPGANDIYVARVDGGIAEPPPPPPICEGDACQPAQATPPLAAPQTAAPNVANPKNPKPSCGKGRRAVKKRGHWRCARVKKKHTAKKRSQKSKQRRADKAGRAGR